MGSDPLWAWVCSVLDSQDATHELLNCVLRHMDKKTAALVWTAVAD